MKVVRSLAQKKTERVRNPERGPVVPFFSRYRISGLFARAIARERLWEWA